MPRTLVTGGAGFVGSSLGIKLKKQFTGVQIIALDNLSRPGSELNLPRLEDAGIQFVKGNVCEKRDFEEVGAFDLLIDAAAECSVQAGLNSNPENVFSTNISGTFNSLEAARKHNASFLFISTSRVYPIAALNSLPYEEGKTRFILQGLSGITEDFPLNGARSLYGATKLSGELLIQEYAYNYGLKTIINRCGIIAGPWQMAKSDQGVITLWAAHFTYGLPLRYIGFGGLGKQVRDVLHIDDFSDLICRQITLPEAWNGNIFNVGGGIACSTSLLELSTICREITGQKISMDSVPETSPVDIRIYLSDLHKVKAGFGWVPTKNVSQTVSDTVAWLNDYKSALSGVIQ